MTLAKARAKASAKAKHIIIQVSITIFTYDRQNIFIVQATGQRKNLWIADPFNMTG
jgi:hypothetical protein